MKTPIADYFGEVLDSVRDATEGEVADYIPQLREADPDTLAVAMCTIDGHIYSAGDDEFEFTIQSISKPFVYAMALQERGPDVVFAAVGMEPSGEAFNELSLEKGTARPMNPMINAGAIAVNSLVNGRILRWRTGWRRSGSCSPTSRAVICASAMTLLIRNWSAQTGISRSPT